MVRRFEASEYFFMQLAMRVLAYQGFKFFINGYFPTFQSNAIDRLTKIDQRVDMSTGFIQPLCIAKC